MSEAISPPCLYGQDGSANFSTRILQQATIFLSLLGIFLSIIYLGNLARCHLFIPNYSGDFILSFNIVLLLIVCFFAVFAQKSCYRRAYLPILSYLWFLKHATLSTCAYAAAMILIAEYYAIKLDAFFINKEVNTIILYWSFPIFLVISGIRYIYWLVYKAAKRYEEVLVFQSEDELSI
uniref:DUF2975 domain-containing protein n=1 Tax=Panagrolaimus sp. ES5 TaxID=591445 RepID=A0AC34FDS0_9BILA